MRFFIVVRYFSYLKMGLLKLSYKATNIFLKLFNNNIYSAGSTSVYEKI